MHSIVCGNFFLLSQNYNICALIAVWLYWIRSLTNSPQGTKFYLLLLAHLFCLVHCCYCAVAILIFDVNCRTHQSFTCVALFIFIVSYLFLPFLFSSTLTSKKPFGECQIMANRMWLLLLDWLWRIRHTFCNVLVSFYSSYCSVLVQQVSSSQRSLIIFPWLVIAVPQELHVHTVVLLSDEPLAIFSHRLIACCWCQLHLQFVLGRVHCWPPRTCVLSFSSSATCSKYFLLLSWLVRVLYSRCLAIDVQE